MSIELSEKNGRIGKERNEMRSLIIILEAEM